MIKRNYRTAMGKVIDLDQLKLANEEVIAVGNMKVNARGDELGPGGEILRTRNQIMNDYYRLNTPVVTTASDPDINEAEIFRQSVKQQQQNRSGLRGNLADSVANKDKTRKG
jgi:hypothetical protein